MGIGYGGEGWTRGPSTPGRVIWCVLWLTIQYFRCEFFKVEQRLTKGQEIVLLHPTAVFQSHISVDEVLGIATLASDGNQFAQDPVPAEPAESGGEEAKTQQSPLDDLYLSNLASEHHDRIRFLHPVV